MTWLNLLDKLRNKFSLIWYEAKDVEPHKLYPGLRVHTTPAGLNARYVIRAGVRNVQKAIDAAIIKIAAGNDTRELVVAAWGLVNPNLDDQVLDRIALINFLANNHTWVKRKSWDMSEYWHQISNYKYFLCPHGTGVQSSKPFECWLVGTIPVVTDAPAYRDLQEMGFPILIISAWEELTQEMLVSKYEDYNNVDWSHVRKMMSTKYLFNRLQTGMKMDGHYVYNSTYGVYNSSHQTQTGGKSVSSPTSRRRSPPIGQSLKFGH
jgi:hypothetical protein